MVIMIFSGELIVDDVGEFRKCGILTLEFLWTWVDWEVDHFSTCVQDPYEMMPNYGLHDEDGILVLTECYWLKLSEWVGRIPQTPRNPLSGYARHGRSLTG
jgi:hypothetical protein